MTDPAALRSARPLLAYSLADLEARVVELGGRAFHARVVRKAVLEQGVLEYADMTSLSADLRARLDAEIPILAAVESARTVSNDGTTKLLLSFPPREGGRDKPATIEVVHMPSLKPTEEDEVGATLCVSTQAGCPVACPFCASGLAGLDRNLDAHEILEQYVRGRALGPLKRSVVMGIGEPFLNLPAVTAALDVVHDEMGLGSRKITVSTVGFPDRLHRAARDNPRYQLAISLHTPDDEQRADLVPAMAGTTVDEILEAGDDWFQQTGREVTYEYALLGGVNDSVGHVQRLAEKLRGRRCTVNVIPYNPSESLPFHRPSSAAVEAFQTRLQEAGVVATVRWSRGLDGAAACGQLRSRNLD